jgi:hypothetical protein
MATCHAGKNLREENEDEKTRAGSKSQAAPRLSFAACASICEMERKW